MQRPGFPVLPYCFVLFWRHFVNNCWLVSQVCQVQEVTGSEPKPAKEPVQPQDSVKGPSWERTGRCTIAKLLQTSCKLQGVAGNEKVIDELLCLASEQIA